jgi:hypothetical protein
MLDEGSSELSLLDPMEEEETSIIDEDESASLGEEELGSLIELEMEVVLEGSSVDVRLVLVDTDDEPKDAQLLKIMTNGIKD